MKPPPADPDDGDASANPDGRITRDMVLAAALELIDGDGVGGLSMRRLARVLHRDPMILYRHAPNKAALLDGVAETVLAQLKVDPADPDWAAQLRAVARGYRALALAHPNVVPLLVTRPLATPLGLRPPGTLRPLEDILTLLTRAGFSGPDALHIYRALFGFLHGHVLNELQELIENPDETDDLLPAGPVSAADPRIPSAAQPRPRPGLLRRHHRTRARPRHPPQQRWRWDLNPRRGCPLTRFRVLRATVHHRPPAFVTRADGMPAAAGERPRTGVNETQTETKARAATDSDSHLRGGAW